jgi:hypothetical protein
MLINESTIHKILMETINEFINEDGATAAMGGGSFNGAPNAQISSDASYDVPLGKGGKNKSTVMRRTFWTAGNSEKTMQSVDDEGTDVVNKRKK